MTCILQKFFKRFCKIKHRKGKIIIRVLFFKITRKITKKSNNLVLFVPPIKTVGKNSYCSPSIYIYDKKRVVIGSFCSIGERVVLGHGSHPANYLSTSPYFYFDNLGYKSEETPSHPEFLDAKTITIGNDVWIGDGVFIKNGITVGDGAILGARALITKDVPPYAIVGGCPAKIIKYRFDKEKIQDLLTLKWWELPDETIKKLPYEDIDKTINMLKQIRLNS